MARVIDEARWDRAVALHESAMTALAEDRLDVALKGARRAVAALTRVVGANHPDRGNALLGLGRVWLARGDAAAALPRLREAAAVFARWRGGGTVAAELRVDALLAVARACQERGAYAGGTRAARTALALATRRLGGRSVLAGAAHNQLGVIGKFAGRFAEAAGHYRSALAIYRRAFGVRSREVATVLHNQGGLAHARGDFAGGEPPARAAVAIARRLLPSGDPERLAHEVAHGGLLDGLGRQRESIPIYRRALAAYTRRFGRVHYEVASTLNNLAAAEHATGRRTAARAHFEETCALLHALRGNADLDLALARYNLAMIAGDRALLRAAHRTFARRLGPRHPHTRAAAAALSEDRRAC